MTGATRRYAALLAQPPRPGGAPPGIDPADFQQAMVEDGYELLAGLRLVEAALAVPADERTDANHGAGLAAAGPAGGPNADAERSWAARVQAVAWPGTPVLGIPAGEPAALLLATLAGLAQLGASEAVVVAGDAPDLPALLLGKVFRGLGSSEVAICPAADGGLVALGCRLPAPAWLLSAEVGLDTVDALPRLRAAAPSRRAVSVAPGWHRLRTAGDMARLDPGLEGWEATRALLSGRVAIR